MSHARASADTRSGTDTGAEGEDRHKARLFDIRTFIAALIGIYGVVLLIMGFVDNTASQLAKSDGIDINLWTGLAMIVAAVIFQGWAMARPVVVPDEVDDAAESDEERRINEG